MKKTIRLIAALLFLININGIAQEIFSETDIKIKSSNSKETTSIVDLEGNINLFLVNENKVNHLKFDKTGKLIFENLYEANNYTNSIFIGHLRGHTITNDNQIVLYLSLIHI